MFAGKYDFVNAAMRDDRTAGRWAVTRHDVDHAIRNSGLLRRAGHPRQVSGVCSAGFITIVHPAANAAPDFQPP